MNERTPEIPVRYPFRPIRSAAWFVLAWSLATLATDLLLQKLDLRQHVRLSMIASLVCGLAGLLSLVPVWLLSYKSLQAAAMGFFLGTVMRVALCGTVAMVARHWMDNREASLLGLWIAGWYLVSLTLDVLLVTDFLRKQSVQSPGQPSVKETPAC